MTKRRQQIELSAPPVEYDGLVGGIAELLEQSRRTTARTINSVLTATYWEIGRRVVEFEQRGRARAEYGAELLKRLAVDLTARFGRGFSRVNFQQMRLFVLGWEICKTSSGKFEAWAKRPAELLESTAEIFPTVAGKSLIVQTPSAEFSGLMTAFPFSWSHYLRLMAVGKPHARAFYEAEAIRGGWSVRQLDRQIGTQFFERTAHSKVQAAMLARGQKSKPEGSDEDDAVVHYSMGHMPAKVFASRYLTDLPAPESLRREIVATKGALETRAAARGIPHHG